MILDGCKDLTARLKWGQQRMMTLPLNTAVVASLAGLEWSLTIAAMCSVVLNSSSPAATVALKTLVYDS